MKSQLKRPAPAPENLATTPMNRLPDSLSPVFEQPFGERLVTLCDGRAGLRGGLPVEVRVPSGCPEPPAGNQAAPVLDFVASDESLDRYGEILSAGGWRLDAYRRNPVFQNAHQYGDIRFTLGRALATEVRDGRLCQRIEFATAVNPVARIAYGLYQGKFLNAVSVGFIPLRWEDGPPGSPWRRKYLEQELLEVSAVGIPANPNALALGLKAGAIRKTDLEELGDLLRLAAEPAATHAGAEANPAPLLLLARELRHLLRHA